MVQMILILTKFCNDPYSDDLNQFDSEIVIVPKHLIYRVLFLHSNTQLGFIIPLCIHSLALYNVFKAINKNYTCHSLPTKFLLNFYQHIYFPLTC